MKKCVQWIICLGFMVAMSSTAMAYTLNTTFDGVTINQANLTTTAGLDQWNDLARWQINSTGDNFAQHTPSTFEQRQTNLLFYGFDAAGLQDGAFSLQFDFINSGLTSFGGRVYLGGLDAGETISRFAPWADLQSTDFFNASLANNTNVWTTRSFSGVIPEDFDVLYLAFEMGGWEGWRGVDNVSLEIAPVPEPSSILLIGAGLGALALYRRRRAA